MDNTHEHTAETTCMNREHRTEEGRKRYHKQERSAYGSYKQVIHVFAGEMGEL